MRRLGAVAAVVALVSLAGWWWLSQRPHQPDAYPVPGAVGSSLWVDVLNGTSIDGLARRVTLTLRRRGIDVVHFGSAPSDTFTTTTILVRRGDSTAALRVRDLLGAGTIVMAPDPDLWLDVTVLLGADAPAVLHLDP